MPPLIHTSVTWSIVGAVVALSAWLASNVQDARDQGGFRWRVAERATTAAPAPNAVASALTPAFTPAAAPAVPPRVLAQATVSRPIGISPR